MGKRVNNIKEKMQRIANPFFPLGEEIRKFLYNFD